MFAKRIYQQSMGLVSLLITSILLTSCGGGDLDVPTSTPTPKTSLTITINVTNLASSEGSVTSIRAGESLSIAVDVDPYEFLDWTWEVSGSSGGNVDPKQGENTVYKAGQVGIDTVTARTNLADGTPIKQSITINVEAIATEIPPPTETPVIPKVTLTSLQNGQRVPCLSTVSGTYATDLDKYIWPVVYIEGIYYPQDAGGKAASKVNNQWYQPVRFGNCEKPTADVGKTFELFIVTANESANAEFEAYITNAKKTGDWTKMRELPSGIETPVHIAVVRE